MRVEFNYSWPTTPYNYFSVFPVRKCRVVSFAIEHIRNITASLHDRDICIGILRYFDSIRYRVFVYAIYIFSRSSQTKLARAYLIPVSRYFWSELVYLTSVAKDRGKMRS